MEQVRKTQNKTESQNLHALFKILVFSPHAKLQTWKLTIPHVNNPAVSHYCNPPNLDCNEPALIHPGFISSCIFHIRGTFIPAVLHHAFRIMHFDFLDSSDYRLSLLFSLGITRRHSGQQVVPCPMCTSAKCWVTSLLDWMSAKQRGQRTATSSWSSSSWRRMHCPTWFLVGYEWRQMMHCSVAGWWCPPPPDSLEETLLAAAAFSRRRRLALSARTRFRSSCFLTCKKNNKSYH